MGNGEDTREGMGGPGRAGKKRGMITRIRDTETWYPWKR